jgi:hypothetical protein
MLDNDYDYDNDNEPPRDFCTAPLVGLGALGVQRYRRRHDAGLARLAEDQAAA